MADWHAGGVRLLALAQLGERYRRYRLPDPDAEAAMAGSFQRYGQLTPVVVCLREETHEILDGFKRLAAARTLGLNTLSVRLLDADERAAKAAIHGLNQTGRRPQEWEEAWIVHALEVREDGMTQVEVAELWAGTRVGSADDWLWSRSWLAKPWEDLRLGLCLPPPRGRWCGCRPATRSTYWRALHRDELTAAELDGVVDLILAARSQSREAYILDQPRPALQQGAAAGRMGLGPSTQPRRQSPRATPHQRPGRPGPHGGLAAESGPRRPGPLRSSGADASLFPAGSRCSQRGHSCGRLDRGTPHL